MKAVHGAIYTIKKSPQPEKLDVKMKNKIRIAYRDENGEEKEENYEGIKAWIIQHEYDHLEGILFTDHLSSLKKRLLRNKFNNISLGKFKATYRVILPK